MKTRSALALSFALSSWASAAWAGGLYFTDRGVRPLGRGGAFIAGADDAGSIAYNPAGLAFTGNQLLLDASWLQYSSTYQREAVLRQVDPNTGEPTGQEWVQTFEPVDGTTPVLPIPTLAYADNLGMEDFNFAVGVWAPYSAITSFPEQVKGQPAPQRYSIISLDGSALAIIGAYVAWHEPDSPIALGGGIEMLTGFFQTSVFFSACVPDRFICAPEQPEYDTYAQLRVGPIFAPSAVLGAIAQVADPVKVGLSFHLPFWIRAHARQDVRLASAAAFENASVSGSDSTVSFELPWTLRGGIEVRPIDNLRVEAGAGYEAWSMHDTIDVDPDGIALQNVAGFPREYFIAPVQIDRGFQDSYSVRLGGELDFDIGDYGLGLRSGVAYETSAIPDEYLSAATVDLDKTVVSVGGSLYIGHWRFDGVFARVFASSVTVDARDAKVRQVNPVLANPAQNPHTINGGTYTASANVIGLGLAYQFDSEWNHGSKAAPAAAAAPPPRKAEPAEPETKKSEPSDEDEAFEKAFEEEIESQ